MNFFMPLIFTFNSSNIVELRSDAEHPPPDTAAMFWRHCTSLDAMRCFLDLFSVLRSLPKITAERQQMERQDDSEHCNLGKSDQGMFRN